MEKRITVKMLRDAGACPEQVEIFRREWPRGASVTEANALRALGLGLPLSWAVESLFTPGMQAAYDTATDTAWAAYITATDTAWAAYITATDTAWAAYTTATAPARGAYTPATAPARAAYKAAIAPARAAYETATASAFVAAWKRNKL